MFRFLLLFLLLIVSLDALSNSAILKRANSFMVKGDKSNHFRAYNDYKNLYLRSIMSDDDKLRENSLKGIVKSGEILHIDISKYKKELTNFKYKSTYKAPKPKSNKKTTKKIGLKSSHKLKSVAWKNDRLILKFDKKLRKNQINYFTLYDSKKKKYKYIFDIHASMLNKSKSLRKDGIKRVKLAQFNPNTLRLVIENNTKLKVRFKSESSVLSIRVDGYSKTSKNVKTTPVKKSITPQRVDRDKIIVLDAGHGGRDPGAVGYKRYREKIIVMQIAKEVRTILKKRGYKVYMTRNSDKYIKLSSRTKYANRKKADIFISIHANAAKSKKAKGIECYFLSKSRTSRASRVAAKENSADISAMNKYGKQSFLNFLSHHKILASNKLAIDLQRGMLGSLNKKYKNVKDGGVREGPFWVLVGAQMPAVLVEVGFVSNPQEAKRLVKVKYQKSLAMGIANGVERYFIHN
ncbi:MAG: N-acetylmuramoyl-L-alanine amidase [Campylobacterota bacterium]|nr:N-acetylmuramoyl-L-alanine amidase [Campylobacterota bacterium]